jgi:hypothetical protein
VSLVGRWDRIGVDLTGLGGKRYILQTVPGSWTLVSIGQEVSQIRNMSVLPTRLPWAMSAHLLKGRIWSQGQQHLCTFISSIPQFSSLDVVNGHSGQ